MIDQEHNISLNLCLDSISLLLSLCTGNILLLLVDLVPKVKGETLQIDEGRLLLGLLLVDLV